MVAGSFASGKSCGARVLDPVRAGSGADGATGDVGVAEG